MMLFGPDGCIDAQASGGSFKLVDVITDSRAAAAVLNSRVIVKTRVGLRFTDGPISAEVHRDQCLATLATAGIPLSHSIRVDESLYSVRDVLADSQASFYIKNEELSWTLTAYVILMNGQVRWKNSFGEEYSIDDLVLELLSRPIAEESCGGVHRLSALTTFLRAVQIGHIKSAQHVENEVGKYLLSAYDAASLAQTPDGAFDANWCRSLDSSGALISTEAPSLLITGHLAQWLRQLPAGVARSDQALLSAQRWLRHEVATVSLHQVITDICPYTHAFLALRE